MNDKWFQDMNDRFDKVQRALDLMDEAKAEVARIVQQEKGLMMGWDPSMRDSMTVVVDYRNDETVFLQ